MKKISLILVFALVLGMLPGCAGTPVVYYADCTCPTEGQEATQTTEATEATQATESAAEGALKTGLYIGTTVGESVNGEAKYDVTVAAVTVDENGVITQCALDSLGTSVTFDETGVITSALDAPMTKNELGDAYNMKAYGGAKYEWYEQAAAVAAYAVGKTAEELRTGSVDESGHAADADLASTATIYIGGYVNAIAAAADNAQALGAKAGDQLKLAIIAGLADSTDATAEKAGNAQLNVDVTAITMDGEVITSCALDSVQAKVAFDATGTITSDITAPVQTKNELGEAYGMKAYAGAKYEWNEQAANFAAYVTGKTADEVMGIAVAEGKPSDADLSATVTIAIGGFQALIEKAAK